MKSIYRYDQVEVFGGTVIESDLDLAIGLCEGLDGCSHSSRKSVTRLPESSDQGFPADPSNWPLRLAEFPQVVSVEESPAIVGDDVTVHL